MSEILTVLKYQMSEKGANCSFIYA